MAADSRVTTVLNGQVVGHDDTDCKIIALKQNMLFASSGSVSQSSEDGKSTWDARATARQIVGTSADLSPREVAELWAAKVTRFHNQDFKAGRIDSHHIALPSIEQAFFVGVIGKSPTAVMVRIEKSSIPGTPYVPKVYSLTMRGNALGAIGHASIVEEFHAQQSARSKQWMQEFKLRYGGMDKFSLLARYAVNLAIRYHPERDSMGGPVDVVEMLPTGIHWVQRKPSCHE